MKALRTCYMDKTQCNAVSNVVSTLSFLIHLKILQILFVTYRANFCGKFLLRGLAELSFEK